MTATTTTTSKTNPMAASNKKPKIFGFLCEWSLGRTDYINPDGSVKGMEHIKTLKIPCSGFLKPEWVRVALENGAQGVFVLGCPLGDCHFNEGNFIINERLEQERGRWVRQKVIDTEGRVAELYLGATAGSDFNQMLQEFTDYIAGLPELVVAKKGAKAAPATKAATPAVAAPAKAAAVVPPAAAVPAAVPAALSPVAIPAVIAAAPVTAKAAAPAATKADAGEAGAPKKQFKRWEPKK
jgi:F420-non-reducing hydrogenase iron-sulfur subunit